jgi:hypothetical protein
VNRFNEVGDDHAGAATAAVLWTTYQTDGLVHAVADVPTGIPKANLGVAANDTEATVYVGTPVGPRWTVTLPVPVNPTPVTVSYNNRIIEVVFTEAATDPLDAIDESSIETA